MKRTLLAMLAALALPISPAAAQEPAAPAAVEQTQALTAEAAQSLPEFPPGDIVRLEIVEALNSGTATVGQTIALRTTQPVRDRGRVVIPAGTAGVAEVIDARPRGLNGVPGLLVVASRYLELNGQQIPLEGTLVSASGNAISTARAVPYIGPVAIFLPGGNFEVAAGLRVSARIAGGPPRVAAPIEGLNPVPSPPPGKALVVFYYLVEQGMPSFGSYGAAENGIPLAILRGNRYYAAAIDPGRHVFEVHARTGPVLRQEIFEGQTIFIRHNESYLLPGDEDEFARRRLREAPPPGQEE